MANPLSATPDVPTKAKAPKGGKFKVAQQPILKAQQAATTATAGPLDGLPPESLPGAKASRDSQPSNRSTPEVSPGAIQGENFGRLPETYHQNTLFLTARDPRWLFSYWDFQGDQIPHSEMREGRKLFFLRVMRVTGEVETLVEIHPGAKNWYVPVREGGKAYVAELGYFNRSSTWQCMVRSSPAQTPADVLAQEGSESFATVPHGLSFEQLHALVNQHMAHGETLLESIARITGEGRIEFRAGMAPTWTEEQKRLLAMLLGESLIHVAGLGSEEIDRLLRKALQEKLHSEAASGLSGLISALGPGGASLFSPAGASWSSQPLARERGFFMNVNAEIIFYGGTQPGSQVTINGQAVPLNPDGTFRFHHTLPDGDFELPIVATSADGLERRSAKLSFSRGTQCTGQVDASSQPQYLEPLMGRKSA